MSILNFPKIPKIALRKSCGEFKDAENRKSNVFLQNFPDFGHIWLHVMYNCPRAPS